MTSKPVENGVNKYMKVVQGGIALIIVVATFGFSYAVTEGKIESNRKDITKITLTQEDIKEDVAESKITHAVVTEKLKNIDEKLDAIQKTLEKIVNK